MQNHAQTGGAHSCPMHPEIKGNKGDSCPKCGMQLEPLKVQDAAIQVKVTSSPKIIEAGIPSELSIAITTNGKNHPLDVSHH